MTQDIVFDAGVGQTFLRYAGLVANRGYIHNTLGNMAIRVSSDGYPHGVAYTKPAGVSLEEMGMEDIVITDIPTADILVGSEMTSVGHNLNREILRLRPDANAVIHVHDPRPDHPPGLDVQGIRVVDVVVDGCSQQVVSGSDGVKITCEVQVDAIGRKHLAVSTPRRATLDAHARPQAWLSECQTH